MHGPFSKILGGGGPPGPQDRRLCLARFYCFTYLVGFTSNSRSFELQLRQYCLQVTPSLSRHLPQTHTSAVSTLIRLNLDIMAHTFIAQRMSSRCKIGENHGICLRVMQFVESHAEDPFHT